MNRVLNLTLLQAGVLRHLFLEVHTMKHSERFALSQWLSEYPDNLPYANIMEMLLTKDDQVTVWHLVERHNADDVWEFIEDTRRSFESTIEHMKTEGALA